MRYYNDIQEFIGGTPLLKLNHSDIKERVNIYAKLELFNPGGSVKDRMGVALIEDAENKGILQKGYTIVEATAGNAGIGIALAALNKGYRIIFAVPEKFSHEKLVIMQALGAEIIHTPLEKGMNGAFEKVEELLTDIKNSVCLSQFTNPVNPKIHYETTGPEIYNDLDGKIDYVVAGAGSGGTISGVMKYLKERNKNIKGILADPVGSTMGGGLPGCYSIEGIGNTFMPETMDLSLIDEVIKVDDNQALEQVKLLAKKEGLLVGTSSGAAMYAARVIAQRVEHASVVVIFPDRGDRYISKNIF
ncbi:PLP-dependent cysteine synthase family protein [Ruminiclostridium papyrosolvens]|uniref:Cysteine synthase n=1 Tax=Ruminiclostridium papyrosolvens C7 TaxID=1330534 RepID=U4R4S7_9FIRM|nr:cysteine synthase family protein [Ruminiclostridium papyrosolvens]EPR13525.1 cysteine synthase [Ruminiclostridium papyrosolvens C7]